MLRCGGSSRGGASAPSLCEQRGQRRMRATTKSMRRGERDSTRATASAWTMRVAERTAFSKAKGGTEAPRRCPFALRAILQPPSSAGCATRCACSEAEVVRPTPRVRRRKLRDGTTTPRRGTALPASSPRYAKATDGVVIPVGDAPARGTPPSGTQQPCPWFSFFSVWTHMPVPSLLDWYHFVFSHLDSVAFDKCLHHSEATPVRQAWPRRWAASQNARKKGEKKHKNLTNPKPREGFKRRIAR